MVAETRDRCTLHVTFGVIWDPSMNFLLKPVIAKALEGELCIPMVLVSGVN